MTKRTTSKPDGGPAPWERENPKGPHGHRHLSPQAKAAARRRAKAAGRPYPNLVDNLHAAAEEKK